MLGLGLGQTRINGLSRGPFLVQMHHVLHHVAHLLGLGLGLGLELGLGLLGLRVRVRVRVRVS